MVYHSIFRKEADRSSKAFISGGRLCEKRSGACRKSDGDRPGRGRSAADGRRSILVRPARGPYVWLCIYDRSSCPCRARRTRRACRARGACCAGRALNALNALHALRSRRTGRAARPGGALYAAARRAAADVAAAAAAGRAGAGVPVVARSINLHTEKSPFIPFTLSSCGGLHKTEYADRPERVPDDEKTGGPKACRFALFRKIQMFFGNSRSG